MKVLVACEFSGVVREAFRKRGHDAWSCDILPALDGSKYHIQGDVIPLLKNTSWDLMIAHPPCTYLCNSGVRWFHYQKEYKDEILNWDKDYTSWLDDDSRREMVRVEKRWRDLDDARSLFLQLWDASASRIAIENPIPHTYAELPPYTQIVQPWMFGHGETKATCLWLKNLPKLVPTDVVEGREARVHKESPGKDRWKRRSITYEGIANAMAEQWG